MRDDVTQELRRTLREGMPLPEAMQQVVDSAAGVLSVTGSGLMFADDDHVLRYVAASDGHGRQLEHVQEHAGTGPCVEALVEDVVIHTDDVTADPRWPELHDELRATRVRAVLGLPIRVGGVAVGSLDAYRDEVREWDRADLEGLTAFGALAEQLVLTAFRAQRHERTVKQLEHALAHRVTIERAVGVLMAREGLDALDAFERLRAASRQSRRRAAEVAVEILESVSNGSH
jgi:GAF domain-containing protein